jgi:hypothetical protein
LWQLGRRARLREALRHVPLPWGAQSRLPERFGVARSTITLDLKALAGAFSPCPVCGHWMNKDLLEGPSEFDDDESE